jgi:Zn-dependent metalloprotease
MKQTARLLFIFLSMLGLMAHAQNIPESYIESYDAENHLYILRENLFVSGTSTLAPGSITLPAGLSLVQSASRTDVLHTSHYRYYQAFNGVKIQGSDFVIHTNAEGITTVANGKILGEFTLNTNPAISAAAAVSSVIATEQANGANSFAWENADLESYLKETTGNPDATYYPTANLMIINTSPDPAGINYRLVYEVKIGVVDPHRTNAYYINAMDGSIIRVSDMVIQCGSSKAEARKPEHRHGKKAGVKLMAPSRAMAPPPCTPSMCDPCTANLLFYGTNKSISAQRSTDPNTNNCMWISRSVCTGKAPVSIWHNVGNWANYKKSYSSTWGNTSPETTTSMFCSEKIAEYYKNTHGRNSFDNANGAVWVYLDWPGTPGNAGWDPMFYQILVGSQGPPMTAALTTIDVLGHELTHGVTQNEASLGIFGEPGAINESFSDIFGLMADFYAKNLYTSLTPNWIYGDECLPGGQRNFSNPTALSHPNTYNTGSFWINTTTGPDNGGIHTNCSVQNYMFYLLSQGGSGTNGLGNYYCVTGIGRAAAEKIAYRVVTTYLLSNETFSNARTHWLLAAADLFGLNSGQYLQVANAWYAVGVGPSVTTLSAVASLNNQSGVYCQGEQILISPAGSLGVITVSNWTIKECNANGVLIPNGASWNSPFTLGPPSTLNVLAVWPAMPCGKYYQVKLNVSDACYGASVTKIIQVKCGPTIQFNGSTLYRCINDPGGLAFYTLSGSPTFTVYQLPSTVPIYSGPGVGLVVNPGPFTVTYKVVATTATGCSVGYWTMNVMKCRRVVDWGWPPTGFAARINGTIEDPEESEVPGFGQAWYVQELEPGTEEPLYTIVNPPCWQQPLDLPVTLNGFNPIENAYTGEVADLDCSLGEGLLAYGHTYRLTRAAWNDYNPYEEYSVIVTPTTDLTGNPGFNITQDLNPPDFRTYTKTTGLPVVKNASDDVLSVYPNPSSAVVNIRTSLKGVSRIEVFDALGNKVKNIEHYNGQPLDMSALPEGIYLLNVYAAGKVYNKKIVLQ